MPRLVKNVLLVVVTGALLAGTMGQGCAIIPPPPPPPPAPVTVELTNNTSMYVQPRVWTDPDWIDDYRVFMGRDPINVGAPLAPPPPNDVISMTFACADLGTLVVDGDLFLVPSGILKSSNILLLQEGEGKEYLCGDTISISYILDQQGNLWTTAFVNGVYLAP
ncbi:MAG: hypothetical protein FWC56_03505 [Phycisphaerae bacterium]|nr:hypothetical protein [Phycisphaerae bacterium]